MRRTVKCYFVVLFGISFLTAACSSEHGFVRVSTNGDDAYLLGQQSFHSTDSGMTWNCLDTPWKKRDEYSPRFERLTLSLEGNRNLFVPLRDWLHISRNGGRSWEKVKVEEGAAKSRFLKVYFFEPNRGLAVVDTPGLGNRRVHLTLDGGKSWKPIDDIRYLIDATHDDERVIFLDANKNIWQSLDRGESWSVLGKCGGSDLKGSLNCRSLDLIGEELWMLGYEGFCRRLNMANQKEVSCGLQSDLMFFEAAGHGPLILLGASQGHLLISRDGGATWEIEDFDRQDDFVSVDFFPDGTAIAAGGLGGGFIPLPRRIVAVSSENLLRWELVRLPSCP